MKPDSLECRLENLYNRFKKKRDERAKSPNYQGWCYESIAVEVLEALKTKGE